ncbi:MAG: M48 family metalloprotease [Saprospiraceae bacterium]
MIGNLINMKYGREQELESDDFGAGLMMESGYDPRQLKGVMDILESESGGGAKPEWKSTHPSHENRRETIEESIEKYNTELER